MKSQLPFKHFAGGAFLHGKDVVVYGNDEVCELRAETCGGKRVPGSKQIVLPTAEYEALRDKWTNGGQIYRGDARIAKAALNYLGVSV